MGRTQFSGSKYFGWQTWVRKGFEILTSNFDFSRFVPGSMPILFMFMAKSFETYEGFQKGSIKIDSTWVRVNLKFDISSW